MMMKPIHSLIAVCLVLAGFSRADAADYWFLKPSPALKQKTDATPVEPAITMAKGILPEGMEGKAYNFDLKSLTQVTAGPGVAAAQYAIGAGTLPVGISLSNEGLLAGTPTVKTAPEGAGFTVVASYVAKTGQQVYTRVGRDSCKKPQKQA